MNYPLGKTYLKWWRKRERNRNRKAILRLPKLRVEDALRGGYRQTETAERAAVFGEPGSIHKTEKSSLPE